MKLHHLTTFQIEALSLADKGGNISVGEMVQGLHTVAPLDWLEHQFPDAGWGYSFKHDAKVIDELNDALMRHANVLGDDETGVSQNGVLFLAATINAIIQSEEWEH